jgi:hypothetical protein
LRMRSRVMSDGRVISQAPFSNFSLNKGFMMTAHPSGQDF